MRRIALRALALPLVLLWLPVFGCTLKGLEVRLVGFGSGDVDGIWLWRLIPSDGLYVRACRIAFSNPYFRNGVELVSYVYHCGSGQSTTTSLEAQVERLPSDPTSVTVHLMCELQVLKSTYRASSYNSAGESALSSGSIQL